MKTEDLLFNEKFNRCYGCWSEDTRQRFSNVLEHISAACGEYDAWFVHIDQIRCGHRQEGNSKGKNLFMIYFNQSAFGIGICRNQKLPDVELSEVPSIVKVSRDGKYYEIYNLIDEDFDEKLFFALSNLAMKADSARDLQRLPVTRLGQLPEHYSLENNMTILEKIIQEFEGEEGGRFTSIEIETRLFNNQSVKRQSAPPRDYCYNRYNVDLSNNPDTFSRRAIFELIDEEYCYRGSQYSFTGDITHNPKGKDEITKLIGRWQDGVITEWNPSVADALSDSLTYPNSPLLSDEALELPMLATNRIYFGPPGTGKTHILQTEVLAKYQGETDGHQRYRFVTFHPSYSYEEFVEGIRAETNDKEQISYEVKGGIFRQLCKQAESNPERRYALIIDEINRGNMAKIFGELITLIEPDKRLGAEHELRLTLPYSGDSFGVPSNLDIYGTMNTADRSLALMDTALRRRFEFREMLADPCLLGKSELQQYRDEVFKSPLTAHSNDLEVEGINLRLLLTVMNLRIERLYDRDHTLGHAFLLPVKKALSQGEQAGFSALQHAFEGKIIPLLEEYFFEDWDKIRQVLGDVQKGTTKDKFIQTEEEANLPDYQALFGRDAPARRLSNYQKNAVALTRVDAFVGIYSTACKLSQVAAA